LIKIEPPQKEEVVTPPPAEGEVAAEGEVPAAEGETAPADSASVATSAKGAGTAPTQEPKAEEQK
jgi:hypothetical protein